jgi:hypothetical protein
VSTGWRAPADSCVFSIPAGAAGGVCELRLFGDDALVRAAVSSPFTVTAGN